MLKCTNCGNNVVLAQRTLKEREKLGKPILCKHCIRSLSSKNMWKNYSLDKRASIMNKVQKGRDNYFSNLSNEEKEKRSKSISNGFKNMTEIQRTERSKKLSKICKERWKNMSIEQYEAECKARCDGWKNMDPEKYKEWHQKIIEISKDNKRRELLRQRQYEHYEKHPERKIKLSIDALNQWNNKSEEEKLEFSEMMKKWWADLSNKQYMQIQEKIAKGIENSNNKKFTENKLETDLANIFNKESIKYIRQYATVEMYDTNSEWYKEYSKYSKFLGYRKNWDFYLPDYDIYIDVDGPFHTFANNYDKPFKSIIEYLANKEFNGFSVIQDYYDTRRLLINKRIIIINYDKELYKKNESLSLNMNEVNLMLTLLKSLKS